MALDLELSLLRTFTAIVDEGGLTAAGKIVGRTQPAVTHQLKRLELLVGQKLILVGRRNVTLTHEGEMLLQYARQMLRLNDEARARVSASDVEGRVILGVPDLYASILPDILRSFGHAYPRIEIELRFTRSVHLHAALKRKEIDLALVTRLPKVEGGRLVGLQPLVWVAGMRDHPEMAEPLPVALLPIGAISREIALEALKEQGRRWRLVSVADSAAGLQAAISAGLAVTVLPQCAVTPDLRVINVSAKLPMLRAAELRIHYRTGPVSTATTNLADFIAQRLSSTLQFELKRSVVRKKKRRA